MSGRRTACSLALSLCLALAGGFEVTRLAFGATPGVLWSEECNGPAGPLAAGNWSYDTGGTWDNGTTNQQYTDRTQNSGYDGAGDCYVRALRETFTGIDGVTRPYTSARITTQGHFSFGSGTYIEMRARAATGNGTWGGLWTLPASGAWPPEIDAVEVAAENGHNYPHNNVHLGPDDAFDPGWNYPGAPSGADLSAWHTYGFYADGTRVDFYFDGAKTRTVPRSAVPAADGWVFDQGNHYLLVNLAIGAAGGDPGATTFPQQWTFDYLRAYNGVPAPGTSASPSPSAPSPTPSRAGTNLILGATFTTPQPAPAFTDVPPTVSATLGRETTWLNQHTFNFGGALGDHRDASQPDGWARNWDALDQRVAGMQAAQVPNMEVSLYAAPVTITGAGDYDYGVYAPLPGQRAALGRWAHEVVYRYLLGHGVQWFDFENELKGYWSDALNDYDWGRYIADYNAIWDAVKGDPATAGAKLVGPYAIFSQHQSCDWGQGEIHGAWGCVDPRVTNGYRRFFTEAHGYDGVAVDMSAGDQSGDASGDYNPGNLPWSIVQLYHHDVAAWVNANAKPGVPIIAQEFYGFDWHTRGQFTEAVQQFASGAGGRTAVVLLWDESDDVAGVLTNPDGSPTALGQEFLADRAAGIAQ